MIELGMADPEDAQTLGAIGFSSWEASAFATQDAGRADRGKLLQEFTDFCRDMPHTILVARDRGKLLGWGAREDEDHVITDLWVHPDAQGGGVGAVLLGAMEAAIAEQGQGFAELETYAGNAGAIRFYERKGYHAVWRGMKFSPSLGYEFEKIRFRKTLGEPPEPDAP